MMVDYEKILNEAIEFGFDAGNILDVSKLNFLPEVRQMCESARCGAYGKNWACPPHCGTIEECEADTRRFEKGIIVQTVTQLEDSFDIENMELGAKKNSKLVADFSKNLKEKYEVLVLGAGACRVCGTCACPQEPCRFPGKRISSMEAYGLLVSDVCKDFNLKYINGANTVTYTNCFLIKE